MAAKVRLANEQIQIFDQNRRKYILLTPEEWVRQHFLQYLLNEKEVIASQVKTEFSIKYGNLNKRPDIAVMDAQSQCWLLVECKSPQVEINDNTMQQLLAYAHVERPKFAALTNGLKHFYFEFIPKLNKFVSLRELPVFE